MRSCNTYIYIKQSTYIQSTDSHAIQIEKKKTWAFLYREFKSNCHEVDENCTPVDTSKEKVLLAILIADRNFFVFSTELFLRFELRILDDLSMELYVVQKEGIFFIFLNLLFDSWSQSSCQSCRCVLSTLSSFFFFTSF